MVQRDRQLGGHLAPMDCRGHLATSLGSPSPNRFAPCRLRSARPAFAKPLAPPFPLTTRIRRFGRERTISHRRQFPSLAMRMPRVAQPDSLVRHVTLRLRRGSTIHAIRAPYRPPCRACESEHLGRTDLGSAVNLLHDTVGSIPREGKAGLPRRCDGPDGPRSLSADGALPKRPAAKLPAGLRLSRRSSLHDAFDPTIGQRLFARPRRPKPICG
jgi:hypothetical protein